MQQIIMYFWRKFDLPRSIFKVRGSKNVIFLYSYIFDRCRRINKLNGAITPY